MAMAKVSDFLHVREASGSEKFIPVEEGLEYAQFAKARGVKFELLNDYEDEAGNRISVGKEEDQPSEKEGLRRVYPRGNADSMDVLATNGRRYRVPNKERAEFERALRASGRAIAYERQSVLWEDEQTRDKRWAKEANGSLGAQWGRSALQGPKESGKFLARVALNVGEGAVSIPTLGALAAEWGVSKLTGKENTHPVSRWGLKALEKLEDWKPEYQKSGIGWLDNTQDVIMGGLEFAAELATPGGISRVSKLVTKTGVKQTLKQVGKEVARPGKRVASWVNKGVRQELKRELAEDAALEATRWGMESAAEKRAREMATRDLAKRGITAGVAKELGAEGAELAAQAYAKALPAARLTEGMIAFGKTLAKPNTMKLMMTSRSAVETYRAFMESGSSEDRAMAMMLADGALQYAILGLGEGVGAFSGGMDAGSISTRMLKVVASEGKSGGQLWAAIGGTAIRILGGAAAGGGSAYAHGKILEEALGEEALSARSVASAALMGAALGGFSSIRPLMVASARRKHQVAIDAWGQYVRAQAQAAREARWQRAETQMADRLPYNFEPQGGMPGGAGVPGGGMPGGGEVVTPDGQLIGADGRVVRSSPVGGGASPSVGQPMSGGWVRYGGGTSSAGNVGAQSGTQAQAETSPLFTPVALNPSTGDLLFEDGSIYRAKTNDFISMDGIVFDPEGNIISVALDGLPREGAQEGGRQVSSAEMLQKYNALMGENVPARAVRVDALVGQEGEEASTDERPVIVWEKEDGSQEIVTGRGRLARAIEAGDATIQAKVVREVDGWSAEACYLLNKADNVKAGTSTDAEMVGFFEEASDLDEASMRNLGFFGAGSERAQAAFEVVREGTEELKELVKGGEPEAEQTLSEAEAKAEVAETTEAPEATSAMEEAVPEAPEAQTEEPLAQTPEAPVAEAPVESVPETPVATPSKAVKQDASTVVDAFFDVAKRAEEVPVGEIRVNDRIMQFKRGADPATGTTKNDYIPTYIPSMSRPIRVMQFNDGKIEVITGRHRLDAAKRAGLETIPAIVYREADGMTVELAKAIDATENVLDRKGSGQDWVSFFKNSGLTRQELDTLGITGVENKKVRAAEAIGTNGVDDVVSLGLDQNLTETRFQALGAIARSPKGVQHALLDAMFKKGITDPIQLEWMGRKLASKIAEPEVEQTGLFGDDDEALEYARIEGLGVSKIIRGLERERDTLSRMIAGYKDLVLRKETKERLGIKDVNNKEELIRAQEKVKLEIREWESPTLDAEKSRQAYELGKEADAKAQGKAQKKTTKRGASKQSGALSVREAGAIVREAPASRGGVAKQTQKAIVRLSKASGGQEVKGLGEDGVAILARRLMATEKHAGKVGNGSAPVDYFWENDTRNLEKASAEAKVAMEQRRLAVKKLEALMAARRSGRAPTKQEVAEAIEAINAWEKYWDLPELKKVVEAEARAEAMAQEDVILEDPETGDFTVVSGSGAGAKAPEALKVKVGAKAKVDARAKARNAALAKVVRALKADAEEAAKAGELPEGAWTPVAFEDLAWLLEHGAKPKTAIAIVQQAHGKRVAKVKRAEAEPSSEASEPVEATQAEPSAEVADYTLSYQGGNGTPKSQTFTVRADGSVVEENVASVEEAIPLDDGEDVFASALEEQAQAQGGVPEGTTVEAVHGAPSAKRSALDGRLLKDKYGIRILKGTLYSDFGRVGCPAQTQKAMPLTLADLVGLYHDLTGGKFPRVMKGPRWASKAIGIYHSEWKLGEEGWRREERHIELLAQLFGLVDEGDEAAVLAEVLKANPELMKEMDLDPSVGNAEQRKETRKRILKAKTQVEKAVGIGLKNLARQRMRAGMENKRAVAVMAHELWHFIDDSGELPSRLKGNLLGHIFNLKKNMKKALPEKEFFGRDELVEEAKAFIKWWRGGTSDEDVAYFLKPSEMYAEIGGAYCVNPAVLEQKAPKLFKAWTVALENHPEAAKAYDALVKAASSGDKYAKRLDRLSETWTREHQVKIRQILNGAANTGSVERWIFSHLWDSRGGALRLFKGRMKTLIRDLKEQYSRGEISEAEYKRKKKKLQEVETFLKKRHLDYGRKGMNRAELFIIRVKGEIFNWALKAVDDNRDIALRLMGQYAHLKRVIELDGRATAWGFQPGTAKKALAEMLEKHGLEKYRAIRRAWRAFRAIYEQSVIENDAVRRMLGAKWISVMERNKSYVTMRHTLSAQEAEQVRSRLGLKAGDSGESGMLEGESLTLFLKDALPGLRGSGGDMEGVLHELVGSLQATEDPIVSTMKTAVGLIRLAEKNASIADTARILSKFGANIAIMKSSEVPTLSGSSGWGAVEFWENGEQYAMVCPRDIADGMKRSESNQTWLVKTLRFLNAIVTTNNPAFAGVAQIRDMGASSVNTPGLWRGALGYVKEVGIGAAWDLASLPMQFIPPHIMRKIGQSGLGRLFLNEHTVEYWNSFGNLMARMIHSGDFESWLQKAKVARQSGNEEKARILELTVQLARQAMEDGILLTLNRTLRHGTDESAMKELFERHNLSYDERPMRMDESGNVLMRVWKSTARGGRYVWRKFGDLSEIAAMTVKLGNYAFLHRDVFLHDNVLAAASFMGKYRDIAALHAAMMAGDPAFELRGSALQPLEWFFGPFMSARMHAFPRPFVAANQTGPVLQDDGTFKVRGKASRFGELGIKMALLTRKNIFYLLALGSALSYGVLELYKKCSGNENAKPEDMKGTVFEHLYNVARWQERAIQNLSPYILQNYDVLPLYVDGDFVASLRVPMPDEVKIINLITSIVARKLLKAQTPDPTLGLRGLLEAFNDNFLSFAPNGHVINLAGLMMVPFGYNPYDQFLGEPVLTESERRALDSGDLDAWIRWGRRVLKFSPVSTVWNPVINQRIDEKWSARDDSPEKSLYMMMSRLPILNTVGLKYLHFDVGGKSMRERKLERIPKDHIAKWELNAEKAAEEVFRLTQRKQFVPNSLRTVPPDCPAYIRAFWRKRYHEKMRELREKNLPEHIRNKRELRKDLERISKIPDPEIRKEARRVRLGS